MKPIAKYIISACLLGAIAVMLYELDHARRTFEAQTVRLVTLTDAQLQAANAQLVLTNNIAAGTRLDITKVLTSMVADFNIEIAAANNTFDLTAAHLNSAVDSGKQTLDRVARTADQASETLNSVNEVVANKDIPKLIRDTRQAVAIAGSAASHIESTANTIAREAPAIADSVQGTAKSVDGIAKDVHKVADDFVAPRPWYKKVLSVFTAAAPGLARFL